MGAHQTFVVRYWVTWDGERNLLFLNTYAASKREVAVFASRIRQAQACELILFCSLWLISSTRQQLIAFCLWGAPCSSNHQIITSVTEELL